MACFNRQRELGMGRCGLLLQPLPLKNFPQDQPDRGRHRIGAVVNCNACLHGENLNSNIGRLFSTGYDINAIATLMRRTPK
jgi:hypothetical protein